MLLGILAAAAPAGQGIDEYPAKAAFLYNLAKFVDWPAETFKTPGDPIVACILGESPFSAALERSVNGRPIEDRTFQIRHISDPGEALSCQILFVSAAERRRPRAILKAMKNIDILTVGESDDFIPDGGIANLKFEGDRIRIQISVEAAARHRLRISPKLLSLAQIIRS